MISGFHHVAFACKDPEETRHFYEDLLGFPLIHTEIDGNDTGGIKHLFFDLGDGSSMAFFYLEGDRAPSDYKTEISTGLGLPIWVNHVAFKANVERKQEVRERLHRAGLAPLMEVDHDWCQSLYYVDPNGIMVEFCEDSPGIVPDRATALQRLQA